MSQRMRLRRDDGQVYLNRWGWECKYFGIFIHKMEAPDPGVSLHDHPWQFVSFILKGGYIEERRDVGSAIAAAQVAEERDQLFYFKTLLDQPAPRGIPSKRSRWTCKALRYGECHRITRLLKSTSWSLVVHGPKRKDRPDGAKWGFYTPEGWVRGGDWATEERAMWNELAS